MQSKIKKQYQEILDSKKIILLTVAGSELLGLSSGEKSDRDEIGVYVEDIREVAGFGSETHVVWRSAEARSGNPGEPSGPGDVDLTLYGLRKFLRLALGGNPTVINVFYAPLQACSVTTELGLELQSLVPHILGRRAGNAFLGYMNQQRLRMLGQRGQMNVNRTDLVTKYGYDTKYAMHMLRLGYQGRELLTEGKLTIPIPNEKNWQNFLRDVKNGEIRKDEVFETAENLEHSIKELMDSPDCKLPEQPDYDTVEKWMLDVYGKYWGLRK